MKKRRIILRIIISAVSIMLLSYYLYAIRTALGVKEIYPTKQGGSEWYFGEFVDKGSVHEAWQMVSILYSLERWQSIDYRWV